MIADMDRVEIGDCRDDFRMTSVAIAVRDRQLRFRLRIPQVQFIEIEKIKKIYEDAMGCR
jgi:hypothetical protein